MFVWVAALGAGCAHHAWLAVGWGSRLTQQAARMRRAMQPSGVDDCSASPAVASPAVRPTLPQHAGIAAQHC